MAVTSIWPVKSNLSKVIRYVENPEKTTEEMRDEQAALHSIDGVVQYAANDLKTERREYVTCIGCDETRAAEQFMMTKRRLGKTKGRLCFHGYQSFRPGEVDAQTAHEIGKELVKRMWREDFEVVIATHCNTGCYHNHYVINSVSRVDGHHFHNSPEDYRRLREISDQICRERGLSVIENPRGHGRNYAEYSAEKNGKPTYRGMVRADIDRAVAASVTQDEFFSFLESIGYELKLYKQDGDWLEHPALKPPGAKGFFRFHKLGKGYDLDEIGKRIWRNLHGQEPFPEEEQTEVRTYRQQNPPPMFQRKKPYLYRLYLRYCYELHIIEKHPASVQRVSFFMREDLAKLDRLDAETRLLAKHEISTYEDMTAYQSEVQKQINDLEEKRKGLRNEVRMHQRQHDPIMAETVKGQISDISKQLRQLRKELVLCEDITLRSAQTREELEWLLEQQEITERQEERNDELFRGRGGAGRPNELGRR